MKGNGNGWETLLRKLWFYCLPTSRHRTRFIYKHSDMFHSLGRKCAFQSRHLPSDPELISIGTNVNIASNVTFVNHDIISQMLNKKYGVNDYVNYQGCIEIGDNVMIGTGVIILPDVRIGSNVIIAAGAVVTKDIPDNQVWGGVPAKCIGSFEEADAQRKSYVQKPVDELWAQFHAKRDE